MGLLLTITFMLFRFCYPCFLGDSSSKLFLNLILLLNGLYLSFSILTLSCLFVWLLEFFDSNESLGIFNLAVFGIDKLEFGWCTFFIWGSNYFELFEFLFLNVKSLCSFLWGTGVLTTDYLFDNFKFLYVLVFFIVFRLFLGEGVVA